MKALLRGSLAGLVGCWMLSLTSTALAEGEPCFNDDDCPGGGPGCGGDVCNWNKKSPNATDEKPYYCNPAGTGSKGADGWCTDESDCKCKAEGAKCNGGPFCSFTKASDAPAGTGGSAAGGSAAGGTSAGGTSAAGTTSTGGSAPVAGSTSTAGGSTTPAPAADDGGCSVSVPSNTSGGALVALGVAGLGLAFARRRRSQ